MRRLIAALACRADGSRLYGKPLQRLDVEGGITILDHQIRLIRTLPRIETTVLGVAAGVANAVFIDVATHWGIEHIIGDPGDVLRRLIDCTYKAGGTDVFRVTTESPFFYWDLVESAWQHHVEAGDDVTVVDGLPEGCSFEIYTLESLERSHRLGDASHRSEYCSLYVREHRGDFKVAVLPIPPKLERLDLRLTVDYPEDLVLCRRVYERFRHTAPRLPLGEIIEFIDGHPELRALVAPYVVTQRLW